MGSHFPSPGNLPDPGIDPRSPALQADSLPSEPNLAKTQVFNYSKARQQKLDNCWKSRAYKTCKGKGASQVVLVVKNPPTNAGDTGDSGLIPGLGRSPGGEHGNPFQDSCLENPMYRGTWQATVHRITKSWMQLEELGMNACTMGKCSLHSAKTEGCKTTSLVCDQCYTCVVDPWTTWVWTVLGPFCTGIFQ